MSSYFKNKITFYKTPGKDRKEILEKLEMEDLVSIYTPSKEYNLPVRYFRGTFRKASFINLLEYSKFVSIPEIYRYSFMDFCEERKTFEALPTVCIVAIKGSDQYK